MLIAKALLILAFTCALESAVGHDLYFDSGAGTNFRLRAGLTPTRITKEDSDGKHYALFTLPHVSVVNETWDVRWGYTLPTEGRVFGPPGKPPMVGWFPVPIEPITAQNHPKPYHQSGVAFVSMKPFMDAEGIASTPREGDSTETGGWRSPGMLRAVASLMADAELKDEFGQPVVIDGCSGPDTAVRVGSMAYRDTDERNLCLWPRVCSDDEQGKHKDAHAGWVHTDRFENSLPHVIEWDLQWSPNNASSFGKGCNGKGGVVNGKVVCGALVDADQIVTSQGATANEPMNLDRNACYETSMHNVWVALGTRNPDNLDAPPSPTRGRYFTVHTREDGTKLDKCDIKSGAAMMSGFCRSLVIKREAVKNGRWWYKPDTALGEAFVFRGATTSPHVTVATQHEDVHRESVDYRMICYKKLTTCPPLRHLEMHGRYAPESPRDLRADTICKA